MRKIVRRSRSTFSPLELRGSMLPGYWSSLSILRSACSISVEARILIPLLAEPEHCATSNSNRLRRRTSVWPSRWRFERLKIATMAGVAQHSQCCQWSVEQILSEAESEPRTVDVYAAKIEPKLANFIIRELNVKAPLPSLGHVKRIRRCGTQGALELSVILCPVNEAGTSEDAVMPTCVSELVDKHGLQPFIISVSEKPARTREEWEVQCQLWPTSFHPNAGKAELEELDQAAVHSMCTFMQMAVQVAHLARGYGQPGNGAIIVDPGLGAVVAWGYDGTGSCCSSVNFGSHSSATVPIKGSGRDPEEHQNSPVMASIETMLSSEPILERGSNTLFKVLKSPECFETHGNNSETDKHTGSKKFTGRQFLGHGLHPLRHAVMAAIEMAAARDRRLFPTDRISKCRPDETEFEDIPVSSKKHRSVEVIGDEHRARLASSTENMTKTDPFEISRPYLCTGFDIYITREPCAMCAMAMVHQRFRRVVYGVPNTLDGALGSRYRLHGKPTLNHHYTVFKVSISEETLL
ncbi:tRNA-specific adenosine deaminase 3 [Marchantia polymorpha subsp. ruderalis]|uniref:CMP/dCMP-type deaminase domain-containing protein n=2 Tax=Marchantia polymorpha TaxID=3197 RepID=A0AAF6APC3_MARPO|nr:hypothetical protein MARPO_0019s0003 [Marchantia polymorpha]BBM98293.1 hypothetical protein Mp_1g12330 [Marchantia polymorpha subsp. ruderalis]|eukprot:PTQ44559.1 hypothetical protein MARPO_0019s0003 [Marchantia polymorpha]